MSADTHIRTTIRYAFASALRGVPAFEGRVHNSRAWPLSGPDDLPCALVHIGDENVDTQTGGKSNLQNREDIAPLNQLTLHTQTRAPSDDGDGMDTRYLTFSVQRAGLAHPVLAAQAVLMGPVLTAAIARAEARLRVAARCVTGSVEIPASAAFSLTTADVVSVADDRIPGGSITGKVTEIQIDIEHGKPPLATVKFGASVGRGVSAVSAIASVSEYDPPAEPTVVSYCRSVGVDDGSRIMSGCRIRNSLSAQEQALNEADISVSISRFAALGYKWAQTADSDAAIAALEELLTKLPTEIDGTFVSIEPQDETVTPVPCTQTRAVSILCDINLE